MPVSKEFADQDIIPAKYLHAVLVCVNRDLLCGIGDGAKFNPYGHITLAEILKIVCYALNAGWEPIFSPTERHGGWAKSYIAWCENAKLLENEPKIEDSNYYYKISTVAETEKILKHVFKYILDKFNIKNTCCNPRINVIDKDPSENINRCETAQLVYDTLNSAANLIYSQCNSQSFMPLFMENIEFITYLFYFLPKDISYLGNLLLTYRDQLTSENVVASFQLLDIKKKMFLPSNDLFVYHHTSLQTLEKLTRPNSTFYLSNAAFLNDPSEGLTLRKYLQNYTESKIKNENYPDIILSWLKRELSLNHTLVSVNSTYIASFTDTSNRDSLPMWYQYGDKGTGCAIEFDVSKFEVPLYKVNYLDLSSDQSQLNSTFKADTLCPGTILDKILTILSNAFTNQNSCNDFLLSFASQIINQLSFMYKDRCYEHEKESRIVVFSDPSDVSCDSEIREGEIFPRTYFECPFSINSIILGPKVNHANQLVVGIASRGLNCPIYKSSLPFQ